MYDPDLSDLPPFPNVGEKAFGVRVISEADRLAQGFLCPVADYGWEEWQMMDTALNQLLVHGTEVVISPWQSQMGAAPEVNDPDFTIWRHRSGVPNFSNTSNES